MDMLEGEGIFGFTSAIRRLEEAGSIRFRYRMK